ncbi:MAG: lipocalin family protein [Bacteroidia bacterium]|nr:lipocalin family protein [Bacteroidia bacterium]
MKYLILTLCALFGGCAGADYPPLDVVDRVDVQRYLGVWHEIARLPNSFQKHCACSKAEYSIIDESTLRVVNSCNEDTPEGEIDVANGKAFIVEGSNNAKLRVQFFWPFRGDYWIIELDDDYQWVVVGTPSREYLWILAREQQLDDPTYTMLLQRIAKKGFDTSKLIRREEGCGEGKE